MSLGFDAIAALPFATTTLVGNVNINVSANALTLSVGASTATGEANVTLDANTLSLDTVEPGVITWNDIIPGATMVWTPIKPY